MIEDDKELSDTNRLLFGSGFVFGVLCTMLVLPVVIATVTSGSDGLLASDIVVIVAAGIIFTGIVGIGLYVLAFPENRLPVESLLGVGDEERAEDR